MPFTDVFSLTGQMLIFCYCSRIRSLSGISM